MGRKKYFDKSQAAQIHLKLLLKLKSELYLKWQFLLVLLQTKKNYQNI